MELGSKKYQKRLIILAVILVISMLLGIVCKNQVKEYQKEIDELAQTIQSTPEEEYENLVAGSTNEESENNIIENITEENVIENNLDENSVATDDNTVTITSKEQALEIVQQWQEFYDQIFSHSEFVIVMTFGLAISGSIIAVMMIYIFITWIFNKNWPDLKRWVRIALTIVIIIVLFTILYYALITIGVFGQIPFILYTLYKFIKLKKEEDSDDVIKEK